jgi:hypothetical protein
MRRRTFIWVASFLISVSCVSRADFKYTVSSEVAGFLSSKPTVRGSSADTVLVQPEMESRRFR